MRTNLLLLFLTLNAVIGQAAPFINLGFEDANTNRVREGFDYGPKGPAEDLLPGWKLFWRTQEVTQIGLNQGPPDNPDRVETLLSSPRALVGSYSLEVYPPHGPAIDPFPDQFHYSLTQRGDIPPDAKYLYFAFKDGPWIASINGEDVALGQMGSGNILYAAGDVSKFAGQTVDLAFRTASPTAIPFVGTHFVLDNIFFVGVPEPRTEALGLVALILAGAGLLRKQRR